MVDKISILNPAGFYLFKFNNGNTRRMLKICPKLTIKTPERHHWRRFGVFIVIFEQIFTHSSGKDAGKPLWNDSCKISSAIGSPQTRYSYLMTVLTLSKIFLKNIKVRKAVLISSYYTTPNSSWVFIYTPFSYPLRTEAWENCFNVFP